MSFFSLAGQNLLSPMVLFFVLGAGLSLARSDLSIPGAIAKLLSLYLMMSIGFRGGVEVAHHGPSITLVAALAAGIALSFGIPFLAYAILRGMTRLSRTDAASVSAHYGSISAVTLVAVMSVLTQMAVPFEGYMIAVAAAMETPAILSALLLARQGDVGSRRSELLREILLNGAVVMLLGSFVPLRRVPRTMFFTPPSRRERRLPCASSRAAARRFGWRDVRQCGPARRPARPGDRRR